MDDAMLRCCRPLVIIHTGTMQGPGSDYSSDTPKCFQHTYQSIDLMTTTGNTIVCVMLGYFCVQNACHRYPKQCSPWGAMLGDIGNHDHLQLYTGGYH